MTGPLQGARIAILVQNLPVPFDRRVWQEATTLAVAGADVTVVSPDAPDYPAGEFTIDGVRVHRYVNPPEASGVFGYLREYVGALARMRRALRGAREQSGPFDAIHFCNPPDLLYLAATPLRRRDGSKLVFDQHDLGPELVKAKAMPLSALFVAIARYFERATYRSADHVVATNESYRSIALGRGRKSPGEVTVVRSGPSREWPDAPFVRRDWHANRQYLIGYLGVMGRQEGIEYLLEAHRLLLSQGLDVQLSLIGSGPDRARLEGLASGLGIADHVAFHGRVSDEVLKSILSDADVCVNPDEVNPMNDQSTMNKIIEYMALGRPIVQFDVREGRFSAQEASLYAAANDAASFADRIADVLRDHRLAARMGAFGGMRFREVLAWEQQGERLVRMYERLLSTRGRPRSDRSADTIGQ